MCVLTSGHRRKGLARCSKPELERGIPICDKRGGPKQTQDPSESFGRLLCRNRRKPTLHIEKVRNIIDTKNGDHPYRADAMMTVQLTLEVNHDVSNAGKKRHRQLENSPHAGPLIC